MRLLTRQIGYASGRNRMSVQPLGRDGRLWAGILAACIVPGCLSPRPAPEPVTTVAQTGDETWQPVTTTRPERYEPPPDRRPEPVSVAHTQPVAEPAPPPPSPSPRPSPRPAPSEPLPTINLDGRPFLELVSARLHVENRAVACRIKLRQPTSQPEAKAAILDGTFSLEIVPEESDRPVCGVEVSERDDQTAVILHGSGDDVQIELAVETLVPMLLVRFGPDEPNRLMNAAVGPVSGDWFDGLFMPEHDWAVSLEGYAYCEELLDRVRLTLWSDSDSPSPHTKLTFRSEHDFLRTRHGLTGYAPLNLRRRELMPAAWMPLDTRRSPNSDEIARNTVWMAINLQPYGAASVLLPGMQNILPLVRSAAIPSAPSPGLPPGAADPHSGLPGISAWECFRQMATGITRRFWGHGLIAQSMSSTVLVGEPLTDHQARLYASVIGLAGESPIACERMYMLPDERIELLRRIIPAAPVRAVDLFAREELPPVWNLTVANGAGQWNVLGLFNTSDEPRTESIELADLHLGSGDEQFAVYDVWQRRLLRIVRNRLQIQVPAAGCRVVSIHMLAENAPTIVGTNRHITCGGIDLHDVAWDDENLTLSGLSDLVANDPYELIVYVPPGPSSFELLAIESQAGETHIREHGPLRVVIFESLSSGPLRWRISFARASQPPQPPPNPPRNLAAVQNTRGVHLSWYQPDDRVVAHRVYRNGRLLLEVDGCEHQDSSVLYDADCSYMVTAVNFCGQESTFSDPLLHRTPTPASTNLTQLVPLSIAQDHPEIGRDRSVSGSPLRIAGQRIYRGIGTTAPSRIVYFLGGGYDVFTGSVGIDDSAGGQGSAIFRIIADGQTLFTSPVVRSGQAPLPFSTRVTDCLHLELVVADADDGNESDHAVWANPYLRARSSVTTPDITGSRDDSVSIESDRLLEYRR